MKLKNIILFSAATLAFASCEDLFEPAIENNQDITSMYKDADFARGVLDNAYLVLPYSDSPNSDLATDDAVSNDATNSYKRMATGAWAANNNPVNTWEGSYHAIQYCNLMIDNADKVIWSYTEESVNQMFIDNYLGNAYALRGLHHFYALRAHAGMAEQGGELLGIPMHLAYVDAGADFNEARLTFKECYDLIMADWNKALEYLPIQYKSIGDKSQLPAKYSQIGADITGYNKAFGDHHRGKIDGIKGGTISGEDEEIYEVVKYGDNTIKVEALGNTWVVAKTAQELGSYVSYIKSNGVRQNANTAEWGDSCLAFAGAHTYDLYNGTQTSGPDAAGYAHAGAYEDFISDSKEETLSKIYDEIMNGTYKYDLFHDTDVKDIMDDLGDIAYQYSFTSKSIFKLEVAAQTIIEFLLNKFVEAIIYYDTKEKISSLQERMIALISKDYMRIYKTESEGKTEKELLKDDVGRKFILPVLEKQHIFANKTGRFSYGVFNGTPVPDEHIVIHKVKQGDEIVLASDGYPYLKPTFAESERLLKEELEKSEKLAEWPKDTQTKVVRKGKIIKAIDSK